MRSWPAVVAPAVVAPAVVAPAAGASSAGEASNMAAVVPATAWTALKRLVEATGDGHALTQLRWITSRFRGPGQPGWTAPGEGAAS